MTNTVTALFMEITSNTLILEKSFSPALRVNGTAASASTTLLFTTTTLLIFALFPHLSLSKTLVKISMSQVSF